MAGRPLRTPGSGRGPLARDGSIEPLGASGRFRRDTQESPRQLQLSTSSRLKISVWSLYEKISP